MNGVEDRLDARTKPRLECAACGYGVARKTPPERCPMCQGDDWVHAPWRPFGRIRQAD